jgi:hypothetical protein
MCGVGQALSSCFARQLGWRAAALIASVAYVLRGNLAGVLPHLLPALPKLMVCAATLLACCPTYLPAMPKPSFPLWQIVNHWNIFIIY